MTDRRRDRSAASRAGLVRAAVDLFAEQGYDGTSVAEVVARAGVTKGALYHHFAAKEDLLYEIYRSLLDEQIADLERVLAADLTPAEAIRAILDDLVRSTAANVRAARVFSREVSRVDAERWQPLQEDWRRFQDAMRRLVRAGQAAGDFSADVSPEVVAWMVFGFTTAMPAWYRPDGAKSPKVIAAELAELVFAGLAVRPA